MFVFLKEAIEEASLTPLKHNEVSDILSTLAIAILIYSYRLSGKNETVRLGEELPGVDVASRRLLSPISMIRASPAYTNRRRRKGSGVCAAASIGAVGNDRIWWRIQVVDDVTVKGGKLVVFFVQTLRVKEKSSDAKLRTAALRQHTRRLIYNLTVYIRE